jgi:hypothetical protein
MGPLTARSGHRTRRRIGRHPGVRSIGECPSSSGRLLVRSSQTRKAIELKTSRRSRNFGLGRKALASAACDGLGTLHSPVSATAVSSLPFTASEHFAGAETTEHTYACIAGGAAKQRAVRRADGRDIDRLAGQATVSAVVSLTSTKLDPIFSNMGCNAQRPE